MWWVGGEQYFVVTGMQNDISVPGAENTLYVLTFEQRSVFISPRKISVLIWGGLKT